MVDKIKATWNLTHIDDESDLTDLSSSDEEVDEDSPPIEYHNGLRDRAAPPRNVLASSSSYESSKKTTRPSTQEATLKSKARGTGKDKWPKPAVEMFQAITLSALQLYDLINSQTIELNPEYQRGVVWNETKQSNFINSLYHRFHAPQIVFNVTYDSETGARLMTCMDGKQRLTSIHNFFDGKIPLIPYLNATDAPGHARRKFWAKKNGNATRPLVPHYVMETLKITNIGCVEYSKLTPDLEREIFQRVQHGVPLNPSDRLPAINGPWADLVRELRNRMNTTEGFEGYLEWGKARGKDFQALAQIVYLAVNGSSPKKAYPSSPRIETFLNSPDGKPSSSLKTAMTNTMDIFCRIAKAPGIGDILTTNLSPLEFVMAAFLIFHQRTALTDRQLSDAISKMRRHAKQRNEDMKFDQPNFKVFSDFVLKNLPKVTNQLAKPDNNEKAAALTPYRRKESMVDRFKYNVNLDSKTDNISAGGAPTRDSGKRKRAVGDDGDGEGDEDDGAWIVEAPSATKSRTSKKGSQISAATVQKPTHRRREVESKARTTVKKSPAKAVIGGSSPAIKPPADVSRQPSSSTSKVDSQVGRPSIRPSSSSMVSVQQPPSSGSRSSTDLGPAVMNTPPLLSRPPFPSHISNPHSQSAQARFKSSDFRLRPTTELEAVRDPSFDPSRQGSYDSRSLQAQTGDDPQRRSLRSPGGVTTTTSPTTTSSGSGFFPGKIPRHPQFAAGTSGTSPSSPSVSSSAATTSCLRQHNSNGGTSLSLGSHWVNPSSDNRTRDVRQPAMDRFSP